MYFLNGFVTGFITGLTCFLIQMYPIDKEQPTTEQYQVCQTGYGLGLIAGLAVTATLIIIYGVRSAQ